MCETPRRNRKGTFSLLLFSEESAQARNLQNRWGDGGNGFPGAVAGEGRNLEVQIVNQKPVLETLGSEGRP